MGINIYLEWELGRNHPDWDEARYAGDRDFSGWMSGLPRVRRNEDPYAEDWGYRPLEIERWRAALPADRPNPERFIKMFDLLEAEPGLWVIESW